jgi:hypothetical protein
MLKNWLINDLRNIDHISVIHTGLSVKCLILILILKLYLKKVNKIHFLVTLHTLRPEKQPTPSTE